MFFIAKGFILDSSSGRIGQDIFTQNSRFQHCCLPLYSHAITYGSFIWSFVLAGPPPPLRRRVNTQERGVLLNVFWPRTAMYSQKGPLPVVNVSLLDDGRVAIQFPDPGISENPKNSRPLLLLYSFLILHVWEVNSEIPEGGG